MKLEEDFLSDSIDIEPRTRSARRARARRRRRGSLIVVIIALLAAGGYGAVKLLDSSKGSTKSAHSLLPMQTSYLVMIRKASDPTRASDMLAVFGLDAGGKNPVTLLLPATALTEIPGYGSDFIGKGFADGSQELQNLVVDNLLGIKLRGSIAMTDNVFAKMIDQAGGIDITISSPLYKGNDQAVPEFDAGTVHMNGARAKEFVQYQAPDETELSRLARARQVWDALFDQWKQMGSGMLATKLQALGRTYNQGLETSINSIDLADFFGAFASAGADNRMYVTLPVTPVQAGEGQPALGVDTQNVGPLISQYFAGSIPADPSRGTRLAVLNGNGIPNVGEQVALRLVPEGFTFVVSKNADGFDYPETIITISSRDSAVLEAARKVRELLGVGRIVIGLQSESVVDLTIIVGHDFPPIPSTGPSTGVTQ
ncbi:MAG: LCP family protein [Actinomycetota bacterium]